MSRSWHFILLNKADINWGSKKSFVGAESEKSAELLEAVGARAHAACVSAASARQQVPFAFVTFFRGDEKIKAWY